MILFLYKLCMLYGYLYIGACESFTEWSLNFFRLDDKSNLIEFPKVG